MEWPHVSSCGVATVLTGGPSICRLRKCQGPVAEPSRPTGPEGLDLGLFTPFLSCVGCALSFFAPTRSPEC